MKQVDSFEASTEQSQQKRNNQLSDEEIKEFETLSLSDIIELKFLPKALQCGIGFNDFFDYTLKEIKIIISAFTERQENELKIQSQMDYVRNTTLTSMMACLFSEKAQMPKYEDVYSFLYDATELNDIEQKKAEAQKEEEMKRIKANMLAMAQSFNAKFDSKKEKPKDGE